MHSASKTIFFVFATLLLSRPTVALAGELDRATEERLADLEQRIAELMATLPADQHAVVRQRLFTALDSAPPVVRGPAEPVTREPAGSVAPSVDFEIAPAAPRHRRPGCHTLEPFDENGDGKINAFDRYWRHLYLWRDQSRDGQIDPRELESAYSAGVREITLALDVFYRRKGSLGEIRRGEHLLFDLAGDGFGDSRRVDDGALAVDASALRRGDGPSLLDAQGAPIEGIRPFAAGWRLELGEGQVLDLTCPPR